jgi:hypothetical protein
MVAHTCNHGTRSLRQEDREFKANLGYIVRPCLKKIRKEKILRELLMKGIFTELWQD